MTRNGRIISPSLSIFLALLSSFCWALSPVLSRLVKDYFSVLFQNLFRFGVSLAVLWLFTVLRLGRNGIRRGLSGVSRLPVKLAALAFFVFLHQMFYIAGIYRVYPALASLISEGNVVYTILLAYFMFHDERRTIGDRRFRAGFVLALAGMGAIILSGARMGEAELNFGLLLIFLSALAWSFFTVFTKKWIPNVPPSLATTIIFSINTVMFALLVPFFLPVFQHTDIPLWAWFVLALSGLFGIGGGYTLYFAAIPGAGVTVTASLGLLIPLLTAVFSYVFLGELLLPLQAAAGGVLIVGCYLIIRVHSGRESTRYRPR